MRISQSQVGQCAMLVFGIVTGAMLFKPGWFSGGVIVAAIAGFIIYIDVPWGPWPDDHEGPRLPDGA
jgi:hypothetical protein